MCVAFGPWLPSHGVCSRSCTLQTRPFLVWYLNIVKRNMVFHSRRLLTGDQTFGDDMLLNALKWSRSHSGHVVERVSKTYG